MDRKTCLDTACSMVNGERQGDYGTPERNFAAIARMWSDYKGIEFTELDVAILMALLKVARIQTGRFKEDSFVDACGYLACGCEIASQKGTK